MKILRERTRRFSEIRRDMDDIIRFGKQAEEGVSGDQPFPEFHHCPFVGLIGKNSSRIGCLLHPSASGNQGIDLRGLSYYGGLACQSYFCPSYRQLEKVYKKLIKRVVDNWYVYGLIITETRLVKAFFNHLEKPLGRLLKMEDIVGNEHREAMTRHFFNLKLQWPYRKGSFPANYFFKDDLYPRAPIDYDRLGVETSEYDVFFQELDSRFKTASDLIEAEKCFRDFFNAFRMDG